MIDVLDIEWDPNNGDKLLALGFDHEVYSDIPDEVWKRLLDDTPKIVFTKADHKFLDTLAPGSVGGPIIDVQVMCWVYDERTPLDLDWCVRHYLNRDPDKRIYRERGVVMFRQDDGTGVPIGEAPWDQLVAYNKRDMRNTEDLYHEMLRRLEAVGMADYFTRFQVPFSRVLLAMEENGLPISVKETGALGARLHLKTIEMEKQLREQASLPVEFNFGSRDQLAMYLFTKDFELPARIRVDKQAMAKLREGEWPETVPTSFDIEKLGREYIHGRYQLKGLGLKPKVRAPKCAAKECGHPSDGSECLPSVSSKVLKVHHSETPFVESLVEYRVINKVLQFIDVWLTENKDGRLYTHFKQTGTATGRLSSSDPVNLQNIPSRGALGKEVRHLFAAPPGMVFVNGDFSQIEPRLMAHYSGDPEMVRVFESGLDLYEEATVGVLGERYPKGTPERQLIRTCFLAMGYGAQPPKIRNNLAEEGFRFPLWKVERSYNDLINLYNVFWQWKEQTVAEAKERRYVETIGGHRRHLDFSREGLWKAERQAVNSIIQGSAADITAATMILAYHQFVDWKLILQVHDEVMFEVPKTLLRDEDVVSFRYIAEHGHGFNLRVPIVFEPVVVERWGEAK